MELRDALHRFALERDRFRTALAAATGVAPTDLDALEHLEAGPLTPSELAERLLLTSGGATVLVDRLERLGWVRRRPHPTDRRSILVELDPSGLAAVEAAVSDYHRALERAVRAVPRPHRAAVGSFLAAAADAAAAATKRTRRS